MWLKSGLSYYMEGEHKGAGPLRVSGPGAVAGGFAATIVCVCDGETGRLLTPRKRETGRLLTPGARAPGCGEP